MPRLKPSRCSRRALQHVLRASRAQRRRKRRELTVAAAKQRCRPVARTWPSAPVLWAQWMAVTSSYFTALSICAFCGSTQLGGYMSSLDPGTMGLPTGQPHVPPYALSNPIMAEYTTHPHTGHWFVCTHCMGADQTALLRRSLVCPTMSVTYIRDILQCTALDLSRLSTLDITLHFESRVKGFLHSRVTTAQPVFGAALVSAAAQAAADSEQVPLLWSSAAADVLAANVLSNPIVQCFKTMGELVLEGARTLGGFALLPLTAVKNIWHKYMARAPQSVAAMAGDILATHLHAVLPVEPLLCPAGAATSDTVNMGVLTPRTDSSPVDWVVSSYRSQPGVTLQQSTVSPAAPQAAQHALVTVESALMPYMFPHGRGFYTKGTSSRGWFAAYLKMRTHALFNPFTLCPSYLPLMTVQKHCYDLAQHTTDAVLQASVTSYKREHPDADDDEVMQHVLKHTVPACMPGSPAFYRTNLLDLLQLVEQWGMPSFFLTLTADEGSDMCWPEMQDLTTFLHKFNSSFTFQNAPVECTAHFLKRLDDFMDTYILCKPKNHGHTDVAPGTECGLCGRVLHHVVRLETQGRGSLHAHIMLWVHPDDVSWVTNEIHAHVPAEHDPASSTFVEPSDPSELLLYRLVTRKQLHICTDPGNPGCCEEGHCKYHFPAAVQSNFNTVYDPKSKRYLYYRPRYVDRNVVPYHPTILLLWGAHMNLQRVTNAAWSAYLLKYALKCEPVGKLNLDIAILHNMGFTGVSATQLKVATSMTLTKPSSPCDNALLLSGRSTVTFSESVNFIDSKPPNKRTLRVSARNNLDAVLHPVDKYIARPGGGREGQADLSAVTFTQYFRRYRLHTSEMATLSCVGQDSLGNYVHELPEPRIVRFSDYHPAYNIEAFCYNMLLSKVPFRHEDELLELGDGESYLMACIMHGLINSQEDLEELIDDYCTAHLYTGEKQHLLMAQLRNQLPASAVYLLSMDDDQYVPENGGGPATVAARAAARGAACPVAPVYTTEPWFQELDTVQPQLTASQQAAFDTITATPAGLYVIQGGPGTGKTYLTRCLTHHFAKQGITVRLTATTGTAAVRLSRAAATVHSAFAIPSRTAYLTPLNSSDPRFQKLAESDVIVIEEFSMAKASMLDYVMLRLQSLLRVNSIEQVLQRKTLVLVGDPNQLPPVCNSHAQTANGVCSKCRVNMAACWPLVNKLLLTQNVRNAADPGHAAFLQHVQDNQDKPCCAVTDTLLQDTFGHCMVSLQDAVSSLTQHHTVICSHHADVDYFNSAAMSKFFTARDVHPVALHTNAASVEDLQQWLHPQDDDHQPVHDHFHRLTCIAKGARVMLTSNMDLTVGAANGALGTVLDWTCDGKNNINMILVTLDTSQVTICVRRTDFRNMCHDGKRYFKSTFPLALAYAITGHASQGLSISTPTIVYIRDAFVAGLAYVMLSRTTTRALLRIVGPLTPSMFVPMPPL